MEKNRVQEDFSKDTEVSFDVLYQDDGLPRPPGYIEFGETPAGSISVHPSRNKSRKRIYSGAAGSRDSNSERPSYSSKRNRAWDRQSKCSFGFPYSAPRGTHGLPSESERHDQTVGLLKPGLLLSQSSQASFNTPGSPPSRSSQPSVSWTVYDYNHQQGWASSPSLPYGVAVEAFRSSFYPVHSSNSLAGESHSRRDIDRHQSSLDTSSVQSSQYSRSLSTHASPSGVPNYSNMISLISSTSTSPAPHRCLTSNDISGFHTSPWPTNPRPRGNLVMGAFEDSQLVSLDHANADNNDHNLLQIRQRLLKDMLRRSKFPKQHREGHRDPLPSSCRTAETAEDLGSSSCSVSGDNEIIVSHPMEKGEATRELNPKEHPNVRRTSILLDVSSRPSILPSGVSVHASTSCPGPSDPPLESDPNSDCVNHPSVDSENKEKILRQLLTEKVLKKRMITKLKALRSDITSPPHTSVDVPERTVLKLDVASVTGKQPGYPKPSVVVRHVSTVIPVSRTETSVHDAGKVRMDNMCREVLFVVSHSDTDQSSTEEDEPASKVHCLDRVGEVPALVSVAGPCPGTFSLSPTSLRIDDMLRCARSSSVVRPDASSPSSVSISDVPVQQGSAEDEQAHINTVVSPQTCMYLAYLRNLIPKLQTRLLDHRKKSLEYSREKQLKQSYLTKLTQRMSKVAGRLAAAKRAVQEMDAIGARLNTMSRAVQAELDAVFESAHASHVIEMELQQSLHDVRAALRSGRPSDAASRLLISTCRSVLSRAACSNPDNSRNSATVESLPEMNAGLQASSTEQREPHLPESSEVLPKENPVLPSGLLHSPDSCLDRLGSLVAVADIPGTNLSLMSTEKQQDERRQELTVSSVVAGYSDRPVRALDRSSTESLCPPTNGRGPVPSIELEQSCVAGFAAKLSALSTLRPWALTSISRFENRLKATLGSRLLTLLYDTPVGLFFHGQALGDQRSVDHPPRPHLHLEPYQSPLMQLRNYRLDPLFWTFLKDNGASSTHFSGVNAHIPCCLHHLLGKCLNPSCALQHLSENHRFKLGSQLTKELIACSTKLVVQGPQAGTASAWRGLSRRLQGSWLDKERQSLTLLSPEQVLASREPVPLWYTCRRLGQQCRKSLEVSSQDGLLKSSCMSFEEHVSAVEKVLAKNPHNPTAWIRLSECYQSAGSTSEQRDNKSKELHYQRREALDVLRRGLGVCDNNSEVLWIAYVRLLGKSWSDSHTEDLVKAITSYPSEAVARACIAAAGTVPARLAVLEKILQTWKAGVNVDYVPSPTTSLFLTSVLLLMVKLVHEARSAEQAGRLLEEALCISSSDVLMVESLGVPRVVELLVADDVAHLWLVYLQFLSDGTLPVLDFTADFSGMFDEDCQVLHWLSPGALKEKLPAHVKGVCVDLAKGITSSAQDLQLLWFPILVRVVLVLLSDDQDFTGRLKLMLTTLVARHPESFVLVASVLPSPLEVYFVSEMTSLLESADWSPELSYNCCKMLLKADRTEEVVSVCSGCIFKVYGLPPPSSPGLSVQLADKLFGKALRMSDEEEFVDLPPVSMPCCRRPEFTYRLQLLGGLWAQASRPRDPKTVMSVYNHLTNVLLPLRFRAFAFWDVLSWIASRSAQTPGRDLVGLGEMLRYTYEALTSLPPTIHRFLHLEFENYNFHNRVFYLCLRTIPRKDAGEFIDWVHWALPSNTSLQLGYILSMCFQGNWEAARAANTALLTLCSNDEDVSLMSVLLESLCGRGNQTQRLLQEACRKHWYSRWPWEALIALATEDSTPCAKPLIRSALMAKASWYGMNLTSQPFQSGLTGK